MDVFSRTEKMRRVDSRIPCPRTNARIGALVFIGVFIATTIMILQGVRGQLVSKGRRRIHTASKQEHVSIKIVRDHQPRAVVGGGGSNGYYGGGYTDSYNNNPASTYASSPYGNTQSGPLLHRPPRMVTVPASARGHAGKEAAWTNLDGRCFQWSSDDDEHYIYEVCPFRNVTQRKEYASLHVIMGIWDTFLQEEPAGARAAATQEARPPSAAPVHVDGDDEEKQATTVTATDEHASERPQAEGATASAEKSSIAVVDSTASLTMHFDDGNACASGMRRQTSVHVICDAYAVTPILSTVREPQTCKYEADLAWVGACASFDPPLPPPPCPETLAACQAQVIQLRSCVTSLLSNSASSADTEACTSMVHEEKEEVANDSFAVRALEES